MVKRHSRKGAEAIALPVVLGVALLILVLFGGLGAMNVAQGLVDYAKSILIGREPRQFTEETFLAAVKCSYLRCAEGCGSSDLASTDKIHTKDGEKDCKTDFCLPYADSENKVCDALAKDHPVYMDIESSFVMSADDLDENIEGCSNNRYKSNTYCCIAPTNRLGSWIKAASYLWIQNTLVTDVLTEDACGVLPVCEAGEAPVFEGNQAYCGTRTIETKAARQYVWTENGDGINNGMTETIIWSTDNSVPCSKLSEPCMRLRPIDAAIVDDAANNIYKLSFYVQGESNIQPNDANGNDQPLSVFAAFGRSWNDISQSGFLSSDFAGTEALLVTRGCNKLDGSCTGTPMATAGSKDGASLLQYNSQGPWLLGLSGTTNPVSVWGGVTFISDPNLKPSTLTGTNGKDLIITFKFKKGGSFDPTQWYQSGTSGIAFYIGGSVSQGKANIYWSPPPSTISDKYVTFTAKTQPLNTWGSPSRENNDISQTDGYCTPGNKPLADSTGSGVGYAGSSDGLVDLAAGSDPGFPSFWRALGQWHEQLWIAYIPSIPAANCRICGKGCPTGLCDNVDGSCSVAWAGAVSIRFQPKNYVCCNLGSAYAWQEGSSCQPGTLVDASACNPSTCTAKCTAEGYGVPSYDYCTDPNHRSGPLCLVCQCLAPGSSTSTTTTTTTTTSTTTTTIAGATTTTTSTTILPVCSRTDCSEGVTQNCKCGTATCYVSNPDYCCASANSCNSYQWACRSACGITTTTTTSSSTTTTIPPSCPPPNYCDYTAECNCDYTVPCTTACNWAYTCPFSGMCCCGAAATTSTTTTTTLAPTCSYSDCGSCTGAGCKWWTCWDGWPWESSGCNSNDVCDSWCWCTRSPSGCG